MLTDKRTSGNFVVIVKTIPELGVAGFGPLVFVESGGAFQRFLIDVEDKGFGGFVNRKGFKRYGKIFVAKAEEAAKTKYGVIHGAGLGVNHEIFHFAEIFSFGVSDVGSSNAG